MTDTVFPLYHQTAAGGAASRTTTFTTEEFPLGSIEEDFNATSGLYEEFIFVHNNTAVAWAQGNIVTKTVGTVTADYECELSQASVHPDSVVGVVLGTVAAGAYAWVMRKSSRVEVMGDGSIGADLGLIPSGTAGRATVAAAVTNASFGIATEVDAGAGTLATCRVDCRG